MNLVLNQIISLILIPNVIMIVDSASWARFFSRSLWTEPMDHFILEESPSHSSSSPGHHSSSMGHSSPGLIQLTPIQFIPTVPSKQQQQQQQSNLNTQSRASSRNNEFTLDASDVYYTIANYTSSVLNNGGSNQQPQEGQSSNGHSQTLFDLLMATNSSLPSSLSSEKYFWISHSAPNTYKTYEHVNSINKEENDLMNSIKNDVTISNGQQGDDGHNESDDDNVPHTKVVSLCDKTLALLDWIGKDPSSAHLSKCELFDLEKSPELAYTEAKKTGIPIQNVSFREMRDIINACRVLAESDTIQNGQLYPLPPSSLPSSGSSGNTDGSSSSGIVTINSNHSNKNNSTKPASPSAAPTTSTTSSADKSFLWNSWRGIFPGTKWCGLGDSAKNYFDLGKRRDVDVCCRAHDHCPIRLKALRMGYGLINLSLYTKSHCDCDEDFMRCLRQANSKSAERLGNFYFNIMKVQCIKEEKSFICAKYIKNKDGKDECVRIEEDKNGTKMVFSQPETTYRR